jgi:hypothetical protein
MTALAIRVPPRETAMVTVKAIVIFIVRTTVNAETTAANRAKAVGGWK